MSAQIINHAPRYQALIEMDEIDNHNTTPNHLPISSLRNSCETLGTMTFNVGRWIINHPVQSILAGSTLLAMGIGAGLGIRALINANSVNSPPSPSEPSPSQPSSSQSTSNVKCSKLPVLVFGANKGTQFRFEEEQSHAILALLSKKQTTDNAHVYLNTKALCKNQPGNILKESIMFSCNNEDNIKLEPKDLTNQNRINKKLKGTQCDPKIEPNLIFEGNLQQGKTSEIKLDGQRMCEQGKIKNFQVKSNKDLNILAIYASENYEKPFILELNKENTIYNIDTYKHCKDIVDTRFRIDCDRNMENPYFTPKIDLTTGKLDLGKCTVTDADLKNAKGNMNCTLSLSLMSKGTCSSWTPT